MKAVIDAEAERLQAKNPDRDNGDFSFMEGYYGGVESAFEMYIQSCKQNFIDKHAV